MLLEDAKSNVSEGEKQMMTTSTTEKQTQEPYQNQQQNRNWSRSDLSSSLKYLTNQAMTK